jgi:two-component system KDP operon response regulator KdpE
MNFRGVLIWLLSEVFCPARLIFASTTVGQAGAARPRSNARQIRLTDAESASAVARGALASALDLARRRVSRAGQPVKLTVTEYQLLRLFGQQAGKVLNHQQILREIWGANHEPDTQYLRVYLARLREKLELDPADPTRFVTEPGVGYRLAEGGPGSLRVEEFRSPAV